MNTKRLTLTKHLVNSIFNKEDNPVYIMQDTRIFAKEVRQQYNIPHRENYLICKVLHPLRLQRDIKSLFPNVHTRAYVERREVWIRRR